MDLSGEAWRAVPGYEGRYEVSDRGRVRSLPHIDAQGGHRRLRVLKPSRMDAWGHVGVKLRRNGVVKSRYAHHLVLEAFVGPRPTGMHACHWNDVPDDNRLSNLRWDTPTANRLDCVRNGGDHNARKTHCLRGHPFTPENTRTYAGRRHCRECQRIYEAAYKARRAASEKREAA